MLEPAKGSRALERPSVRRDQAFDGSHRSPTQRWFWPQQVAVPQQVWFPPQQNVPQQVWPGLQAAFPQHVCFGFLQDAPGPVPQHSWSPGQLPFPQHVLSTGTQKFGEPVVQHFCLGGQVPPGEQAACAPARVDPTVPTMAATSAPPSSLSARRRGTGLARMRAASSNKSSRIIRSS
jgi:hypothetical protein